VKVIGEQKSSDITLLWTFHENYVEYDYIRLQVDKTNINLSEINEKQRPFDRFGLESISILSYTRHLLHYQSRNEQEI
jgi:hypothetical protein